MQIIVICFNQLSNNKSNLVIDCCIDMNIDIDIYMTWNHDNFPVIAYELSSIYSWINFPIIGKGGSIGLSKCCSSVDLHFSDKVKAYQFLHYER